MLEKEDGFENESWTFNGNILEVVNDFNYLGVVFNYTGSFGKSIESYEYTITNDRGYDFSPKTPCQLFDFIVASILNYCSEVWGYTTSKQIERIHLKYCKKILCFITATSNVEVSGGVERYPFCINIYVQILKYWFKLPKNPENFVFITRLKLEDCDCMAKKKNWI